MRKNSLLLIALTESITCIALQPSYCFLAYAATWPLPFSLPSAHSAARAWHTQRFENHRQHLCQLPASFWVAARPSAGLNKICPRATVAWGYLKRVGAAKPEDLINPALQLLLVSPAINLQQRERPKRGGPACGQ
ncbi:MAG: hypothetical protein EB116_18500 [Betaproteobacteria bacterium]|nr:hypothetical protein [Betaproteobacteria bacterium]